MLPRCPAGPPLINICPSLCPAGCLQVAAGGTLPRGGAGSQFYPPTVITGVTPDMRIWQEEVFGPVMAGVLASHAGVSCMLLGLHCEGCQRIWQEECPVLGL